VLNCDKIRNVTVRVMSYIFALQFRKNLYFLHCLFPLRNKKIQKVYFKWKILHN